MKKVLFFILLCLSAAGVYSQTNTWDGSESTSWNNPLNWSLNVIPLPIHNVVIPSGSLVNLNVNAAINSIDLQGTSQFNVGNTLSILANSSFGPNTTVIWSYGALSASGTPNVNLSTMGLINVTSVYDKSIIGGLTLNNTGTIAIVDSGDLHVSNGILNNQFGGTVDLQENNGNISYSGSGSHVFNNYGTLKKSVSTGAAAVLCTLLNTGVISVESGTMVLQSANATLDGGIYNVAAGTFLTWDGTVNLSGTLSGTISGAINWTSVVSVASTALLDFSGAGFVDWSYSALTGGGVLTNDFTINLTSVYDKSIVGTASLNNTGIINIASSGDFMISNGTLNNLSSGVIDLRADNGHITYSGSGLHNFSNAGLIKRTTSSGNAIIASTLTNTGTIAVETGVLTLTNAFLNSGIYNVSTPATLVWDGLVNLNGNLTGTIAGNINWISNVKVVNTAKFDFSGSGSIDWYYSVLSGGGILTNDFTLNLTSVYDKSITDLTTLNNINAINIVDSGDLDVSNGFLNNSASGIIDMRVNDGNVSYSGAGSHLFTNAGLLEKTTSTGNANIYCSFTNTGTVWVKSGNLTLNTSYANLNGGIYNTDAETNLVFAGIVNLAAALTGVLNGNLLMTTSVSVLDNASYNFTGLANVVWNYGNITGGGVLTNNSVLSADSVYDKSIIGETTIINNSIIKIISSGDLNVSNGYLNNSALGVIDMQVYSGNISYSGSGFHQLNNAGTIKKTSSDGEAGIYCDLNNIGSLFVEQGSLKLSNPNITLNGGSYSTNLGANLEWASTITISGALSGINSGTTQFTGLISVPVAATLNITGNPVNWTYGSISGPGTLTSNSKISLTSVYDKAFVNDINFVNNSIFSIDDSGDMNLNSGLFTNGPLGTIDLRFDSGHLSYSGTGTREIINYGKLLKSQGTGASIVYIKLTNYGIIESASGTLNLASSPLVANQEGGTISGIGTIALPTNPTFFVNAGNTSPGGIPGTLTFTGSYKSQSTSKLIVDIDGNSIGEYDKLILNPGGILGGSIEVNLGYAAAINDTFNIISLNSGAIANCSLPVTPSVFNNLIYYFVSECGVVNSTLWLRVISIQAAPPVAETQSFCNGVTVADLVAEGENLKWYDNASGGLPLPASTLLLNDSYYVSQTVDGYESARVEIVVTITTTPAPTASNQSFNGGATVADLVANGMDINWYDQESGGEPLASQTALVSATYYVTQTVDSCESIRLAIQVTIDDDMYPFYVDADDDGFGAGELVMVIAPDPETPPSGYSLNNTDCDDNNAVIYQSSMLFADNDGDGYTVGEATSICYGATIPQGYVMQSMGDDCDDNNASLYQSVMVYADNDSDGYTVGEPIAICLGTEIPEGYTETSLGEDCNDNDATVYQLKMLFVDNDGDGYTMGEAISVCYGATIPEGYSEDLLGVDCNDNDANAWRSATVYVDMDGDGFHGQMIENYCYGASLPANYSTTTLGVDCYDSNAAINPGATEIVGNGIDENCNGMADDGAQGNAFVQCGATIEIYKGINTGVVQGATGYRFKVTNVTNPNGPNAVQVIDTTVPYFQLTNLASYEYNTTYSVQVAVKTTGDYGDYSGACNISTRSWESLPLSIRQCGTTYTSKYRGINATVIPNVSGYRFRFTNLATNVEEVITSAISYTSLSALSTYVAGATYSVEVAVKTTGDFGHYGPACNINAPAAIASNGTTIVSADFKVVASPNPFSDTFALDITEGSAGNAEVRVFDMIGKLLEVRSVQSSDLSSQRLGNSFPSGVYNVVVTQGDAVRTLKVIKR